VGYKKPSQHERARHLDVLRIEKHLSAIHAIGEDAPEQRKQHDGQLAKKQVEAQIKRVFGEIVDQPALRELLHKRSRGRDTRPNPHKPEVAMAKRTKHPAQNRRRNH
jgi:hypothetical protein